MAGINNNLYPPIFSKSYMPAFVRENGCRVYFSISIYNSLAEMHHTSSNSSQVNAVQVAVQSQKTNQTVLSTSLYPSGIKLTNLNTDVTRNSDDIYYVDILNSDIQGGFNLNQYYKVQIRFTSSEASNPPTDQSKGIDAWLSANLAAFSQWSTVVLIRPISYPNLLLNSFNNDSILTTFTLNDIIIAGKVNFADSKDQQTVQKYRIRIYDDNQQLLQDSGDINTNAYSSNNQIYYKCKYDFVNEANYILGVQILTQNLYEWPEQKRYNFNVNFVTYMTFTADISAVAQNQASRIKVHIQRDSIAALGANIVIKRTSNKQNFTVWEDVHTFLVPANNILNYTWYDYTIENGTWYLYRAEQRNKQGYRSTSIQIPKAVMVVSEDIFLTTSQNQLKVRFDPQVSNFSHVVSESLTETIGSQYPFIRRNGNVNYRTFSLSGTITHFMDIRENLMHSSKNDLYGSAASLYTEYNNKNNVNLFNDVIYERQFRKKVIEFLYKNDVKLYKSATEGNMLVKLMNISFTPNTTLSRQIYSFTCTAYEIDECTYENCIKYNIQDGGSYQASTEYLFSVLSQLNRPSGSIYFKESGSAYFDRVYSNLNYFGTAELIENSIRPKYDKWETKTLDVNVDYLSYLKIELTSKPYLIGIDGNGNPYKITGSNNGTDAVYLGHIARINNKYIIISKQGIYELSDPDTVITSLSFVDGKETGSISFIAVISEEEKQSAIPKEYSNFSKIGQYWGFFNVQDSVYRKILNKYNQSYTTGSGKDTTLYEQEVQTVPGLRIQANPGTVFYVRQAQDYNMDRHVMGATGLLEFYDDSTNIQGLYFVGSHLRPAINENFAQDEEFIDTGLIYDTFEQIEHPIKNGVYTIIDRSETADASQLSTQGLEVSAQDLATIAALAEPAGSQDTLKLSNKIQDWLEDSSYFTNLPYKQKQVFVDLVYQAVLKQYIESGNRYIYYQGGWYPFTQTNDVVVPSIQAIVDYYCTILRKRY